MSRVRRTLLLRAVLVEVMIKLLLVRTPERRTRLARVARRLGNRLTKERRQRESSTTTWES